MTSSQENRCISKNCLMLLPSFALENYFMNLETVVEWYEIMLISLPPNRNKNLPPKLKPSIMLHSLFMKASREPWNAYEVQEGRIGCICENLTLPFFARLCERDLVPPPCVRHNWSFPTATLLHPSNLQRTPPPCYEIRHLSSQWNKIQVFL